MGVTVIMVMIASGSQLLSTYIDKYSAENEML